MREVVGFVVSPPPTSKITLDKEAEKAEKEIEKARNQLSKTLSKTLPSGVLVSAVVEIWGEGSGSRLVRLLLFYLRRVQMLTDSHLKGNGLLPPSPTDSAPDTTKGT